MKALAACLCALLVALQWRLWFGEGSLQEVSRVGEEARAARAEVLRLQSRERALAAEVADLKSGLEAIEERARSELGMIDEDETFFRFVRGPGASGTGDRAGSVPVEAAPSEAVPIGTVPVGTVPSEVVPAEIASDEPVPADFVATDPIGGAAEVGAAAAPLPEGDGDVEILDAAAARAAADDVGAEGEGDGTLAGTRGEIRRAPRVE